MKKIILALLALMLSCGVASAQISESVTGNHLDISSRTTAPFNDIFTCKVYFSSTQNTEKLNYTILISIREPQNSQALYFKKKPVLTLSNVVASRNGPLILNIDTVPFQPTNRELVIWNTNNVNVTPNGDGSYSASREVLSGFSDALIFISNVSIAGSSTNFNNGYLFPALRNGTPLSMTAIWYKTKVDAFKGTNPQTTRITIPAATIVEWREVLHQAGFDNY